MCAHLGRDTPFLSYLGLVMNNWRPSGPQDTSPARPFLVKDVRLLAPALGTDEEPFFYLTQLELLSRGTPLVAAAVDAHPVNTHEDARALTGRLLRMTECVRESPRWGLRKIDPRLGRRFHVDPVVRAKTVARLAMPLVRRGLGPSGTASPMFHLLDSVIGRTGYRSFIGARRQADYEPTTC